MSLEEIACYDALFFPKLFCDASLNVFFSRNLEFGFGEKIIP